MPIRNYGLHWDRTYGMKGRRRGSPVVNFEGLQVGIYVLYRSGLPFYVGRSGDGEAPSISGRLVDHSRHPQKVGQWDSFSWFGFRPVGEDNIVQVQDQISMLTGDAISDIEALLIHLLRQIEINRRPLIINKTSGRYSHMDEYTQVTELD